MRRLSIVLAAVAFCTAPTWADSIELNVNAWATITVLQPGCSSNCTETIGVSFLYNTPSITYSAGQIVPGSLEVSSSGFLGSFSGSGYWYGANYSPLLNSFGDEIDLYPENTGLSNGIQPGINTVGFLIYSCQSQLCENTFGATWIIDYSSGPINPYTITQASIAVPVAVPDGTSFLSLALTSMGAVGMAWRWRTA